MPALLRLIWYFILSVAPYIVTYILRAVGFGLITFTGLTLVIGEAEEYVFRSYEGLPTEMYQILAMAGFPLGIKILFTAFSVAIAIKTAIKPAHPVWRKPGSPWEA